MSSLRLKLQKGQQAISKWFIAFRYCLPLQPNIKPLAQHRFINFSQHITGINSSLIQYGFKSSKYPVLILVTMWHSVSVCLHPVHFWLKKTRRKYWCYEIKLPISLSHILYCKKPSSGVTFRELSLLWYPCRNSVYFLPYGN